MTNAPDAISPLWQAAGMPAESLSCLTLTGRDPALPSSFAVGTAAQATLGAAALAATELGHRRNGLRQQVRVDMRHAALECIGRFEIDGRAPGLWDKIAGPYRCGDGRWVRLHTNFAHHRDGVLRLLGLPLGGDTSRAAVAAALQGWQAVGFEEAAARAGMVVAAVRSFDEWDRHPQRAALAAQPLVAIECIGAAEPLALPALPRDAGPLHGLRVLDLTRILAGPVAGRTLAAYGADVMLVNAPQLPNIEAIIDTSRGKLSALADLREPPAAPASAGCFATRMCSCRAIARAPSRRWASRLPTSVRFAPASSRSRSRPTVKPGLGPRAGVSIPWCRARPASTWPKQRPPARPSRKRCRCRSWTWRPAF